jgi:hypothetical protein
VCGRRASNPSSAGCRAVKRGGFIVLMTPHFVARFGCRAHLPKYQDLREAAETWQSDLAAVARRGKANPRTAPRTLASYLRALSFAGESRPWFDYAIGDRRRRASA